MNGQALPDAVAFISAFIDEHGYSPTVREIRDGVGVSSMSYTNQLIAQLVARGAITMIRGRRRSIRIADPAVVAIAREMVYYRQGVHSADTTLTAIAGLLQKAGIGLPPMVREDGRPYLPGLKAAARGLAEGGR